MLPGVCQDLYNKINYIQSKLIDQEIQLIVQLQKPYKCVIKKQFLHIYRDDVPIFSLALCFPSIIHWELKEHIIGFRLRDSYQSDESHKIKKLLDGRVFYTKVQDFYEPIEVLGKGSQAKVLLVRCKLTQNLFAAKCIPINEISFQEIEINRLLKHKAFCKLHEVFQGQTSYYIIMERLSGKNLMEIMRKQTVNLEQVKKIMKDLLEGLDYMHKLNIMHRDLKPENLVLHKSTDETMLKIVDFGLATYSTLKKYKYPKCGTPGYVAPEVCNYSGGHYGTKCDIFSSGCIFYLLLTGKHLFSGQGYNFVLEQNKLCKIDLQLLSSYPQYLVRSKSKTHSGGMFTELIFLEIETNYLTKEGHVSTGQNMQLNYGIQSRKN
ncbi:hypothetical protein pb186bvf_017262 [Paramecium bursaria]